MTGDVTSRQIVPTVALPARTEKKWCLWKTEKPFARPKLRKRKKVLLSFTLFFLKSVSLYENKNVRLN